MKGYRAPSYPRREAVGVDTLLRWMPSRWRRSGKVAAGMAILFAAPAAADVSPPPPTGDKRSGAGPEKGEGLKQATLPRVFEHGEGRGAFGCVAVAPPAFLTEQDARQVILEEFARVGVKFEMDKKVVPGLRKRKVEVTYKVVKEKDAEKFEEVRKESDAGPLTLDGYDASHNLGFEYISEHDYFELGGDRSMSTVQAYDFKPLAKRLADDARRDGSVRLGVFYDPMARVDWDEDGDGDYHAPKNVRGREQLRAQVRDFIAWLKREKVL